MAQRVYQNFGQQRMLKLALGASAAALSLGASATSFAQEAAEAGPAGDIVVTGSRVQRDGYTSPTPTTIITADDLLKTAPANVADAVNRLPALSGSTTPRTVNNSAIGTGGANLLNLRNLGAPRSLVLLSGRRVVASAANGAVDINLLPTALLKRVDVVTGGASAAYGSDAVAGVVNFVLDEEYEGLKGSIQAGISQEGDGAEKKGELSWGTGFAGGRGHIVVSGSYTKIGSVDNASSRSWYSGSKLITNPAYVAGGSAPQYIIAKNVGLGTVTPGGLITAGALKGTMFNADGTTSRFDYGYASGLLSVGGTANDFAENIQLQPDQENYNVFSHASYELTDSIKLFGEFSYARSKTNIESVPYFRFGNVNIAADNAYLPDSITTGFTMGTYNASIGAAQVYADRKVTRWVGGLEGDFGGGWTWNAYYQDGLSKITNEVRNNTIVANYARAIDAVDTGSGTIVCRSTLTNPTNGCVPINTFGGNAISDSARDYVTGTAVQHTRIHEQVASANIQGEPFSTWAGPVSIAAGGEWRRESFSADADAISQASGFWLGNYKASSGGYNIKEGYLETVVPLLGDQPFVKSLELSGAARVTDYSTSGTVVTWKAGLTWEINDSVKLRGTRSRDIRAPNFNDLYQGGTSVSITVNDGSNGTYSTRRVVQGNRDLKPEIATTWAGGIVFQPSFLPGFAASADYYDIAIEDAITTPTQQQVVDGCAAGNTLYCGLVTRGSDGLITQIITPGINANEERVRGLDIDLSYRTDLLGGQIMLRALGTHVFEHSITSAFTGKYEYVGDYGGDVTYATPAWRASTSVQFIKGPFTLGLQERFISAGRVSNAYTSAQLANNHVDSVFYSDLNMDFAIGDDGKKHFFMAVENLFNQDPPVAPSTTGNGYGHIGTNTTLYDVMGRYFRVGFKVEL